MTAHDLNPCPFCGNRTKPKVMDWDGDGFPGYEVRCDASGWEGLDGRGCGAGGGWGETPDEAITAWNRRALSTVTPAEVGGLVERLRTYRSCNEWGDPVHHTICDDAATALEAQAAELAAKDAASTQWRDALDSMHRRALEAETSLASERAAHAETKRERDEARKALEPFANVAEHDIGEDEDDSDTFWPMSNARYSMPGRLRVGHLRAAIRALTGGKVDG